MLCFTLLYAIVLTSVVYDACVCVCVYVCVRVCGCVCLSVCLCVCVLLLLLLLLLLLFIGIVERNLLSMFNMEKRYRNKIIIIIESADTVTSVRWERNRMLRLKSQQRATVSAQTFVRAATLR